MICEICGNEHNGSYGSGKFCSRSCSNTRKFTEESKAKISKALSKLPKKFCKICGKEVSKRSKTFICIGCIKNGPKKSRVSIRRDHRRKRKLDYIEYKGGKCSICGYSKCVWALEFHHQEKHTKDNRLSDHLYYISFNRAKLELDKCILVCANCHREIHSSTLE